MTRRARRGSRARRARRDTHARRGVALVLVLWLLVVLGGLAAGITGRLHESTVSASNLRAALTARYAAESGIAVARATMDDSLFVFADDTVARRRFLNDLEHALGDAREGALGAAQYAVAFVDLSARLDLNTAEEEQLARFFSAFTGAADAARIAAAIRARIEPRVGPARPLRSLDELREIAELRHDVALEAAPYLTVDGDGVVNRATASALVLAAAGGERRDEPSRVLVVSRGWAAGSPLTHEIQAVYAVARDELVLVRWRERDR